MKASVICTFKACVTEKNGHRTKYNIMRIICAGIIQPSYIRSEIHIVYKNVILTERWQYIPFLGMAENITFCKQAKNKCFFTYWVTCLISFKY